MNQLLDNKKHGSVSETLKNIINPKSKLSFISSFFTIYAYKELKKELESIDSLRFLFVEPTFVNDLVNKEVREYTIGKLQREVGLSGNNFEIRLKNELKQSAIARECANWIKNKVQMKSLSDASMAPTMLYHVSDKESHVINGNSDFSADGLGFVYSNKMYVNTYSSDQEMTKNMLSLFDELWNDKTLVEDVKEKVLDSLMIIYKENSPELLYYATLYNLFKDYIDELDEDNILKTKTGFKETLIWNKLYKFQKDGVLGSIDKLERYNGCIIADSVGLGKTFEALAVIKYYELRNYRVLVLCPKKLKENWTIFRTNDKRNLLVNDRFSYDVLSHTDLSRYSGYAGDINLETLNWNNYDLIVIDESHNFRNNDPRKDRETRYSRLLNKVIKEGVKTKVLMLSATPVNNRMNDLKNQIAFITEGKDTALIDNGIKSISLTLKQAQTIFNRWSELPDEERTLDNFLEKINFDYFRLLDTLTIARSRKHITKYYNTDDIGEFPKRLKPDNHKINIDTLNEFPTLKEINNTIRKLTLAAYAPLKYIKIDKKEEYSQKYDMSVGISGSIFKQTDREESLIHLMRVNLLKRMESSIHSFYLTSNKISQFNIDLLLKIENNINDSDDSLSISSLDLEDEEFEDLLIGNKVKVLLQDVDLVRWQQDLLYDNELLKSLVTESMRITPERDEKLQHIKSVLNQKITTTPYNSQNKKVIIFTAFADTANYLYQHLSDLVNSKYGVYSALVTGSSENKTTIPLKNKNFNAILTLFSPISKEKDRIYPEIKDQIDILIATDCISEGQNLQDCDCVINYDIHWNPVRIIQRFGRIDRLGSTNKAVK